MFIYNIQDNLTKFGLHKSKRNVSMTFSLDFCKELFIELSVLFPEFIVLEILKYLKWMPFQINQFRKLAKIPEKKYLSIYDLNNKKLFKSYQKKITLNKKVITINIDDAISSLVLDKSNKPIILSKDISQKAPVETTLLRTIYKLADGFYMSFTNLEIYGIPTKSKLASQCWRYCKIKLYNINFSNLTIDFLDSNITIYNSIINKCNIITDRSQLYIIDSEINYNSFIMRRTVFRLYSCYFYKNIFKTVPVYTKVGFKNTHIIQNSSIMGPTVKIGFDFPVNIILFKRRSKSLILDRITKKKLEFKKKFSLRKYTSSNTKVILFSTIITKEMLDYYHTLIRDPKTKEKLNSYFQYSCDKYMNTENK